MNPDFLNRLLNFSLIVIGSFLAFKAQNDSRYAWAIPVLQYIHSEMPSVNLLSPKKVV